VSSVFHVPVSDRTWRRVGGRGGEPPAAPGVLRERHLGRTAFGPAGPGGRGCSEHGACSNWQSDARIYDPSLNPGLLAIRITSAAEKETNATSGLLTEEEPT
jgi:hypothetical protein